MNAYRWPKTGPNAYQGTLTPEWMQGRGAFGGLLAAAVLHSWRDEVDPERLIRSMTVHFCGPVSAGPITLHTQIETSSRSVTQVSARMIQGGAVKLTALGTFAKTRTSALTIADDPPPKFPVGQGDLILDHPAVPRFSQFFEYRFAVGDQPFSGATRALTGGSVRTAKPCAASVEVYALILDAWPLVVANCMPKPAPASTVDFSLQFFHPQAEPTQPDDWYMYQAESNQISGGYSESRATLWNTHGQALVRGRQLIAFFG